MKIKIMTDCKEKAKFFYYFWTNLPVLFACQCALPGGLEGPSGGSHLQHRLGDSKFQKHPRISFSMILLIFNLPLFVFLYRN